MKSVTIEVERDKDGKQWVVIRCACHAWQYARRSTVAEAKTLAAAQGWQIGG